ncbi:unnamed protein product [Bursaphelenchus xylophilus]|uniref:(pine wood nematode) hypothetical protein n=1 Tax=Bursaphelenchus xylophilus TaxID=6326 RepID=A0A1I7RLQ4_BURXY|nr:unnamed protein product [Bursaphelenchus xylophilus]CAG9082703.1 unnamed protein product [Bursaphelenchus xylophilus]
MVEIRHQNEDTKVLGRIGSGFEWDVDVNIHGEDPGHGLALNQEPVNTPMVRPEKKLNSTLNRASKHSVSSDSSDRWKRMSWPCY